jgi:Na+/H+-dicarboxylate symporter
VPFGAQILAGLALGLLLGFVARSAEADWLADTLAQIGDTFDQLLVHAVRPLLYPAVVLRIA